MITNTKCIDFCLGTRWAHLCFRLRLQQSRRRHFTKFCRSQARHQQQASRRTIWGWPRSTTQMFTKGKTKIDSPRSRKPTKCSVIRQKEQIMTDKLESKSNKTLTMNLIREASRMTAKPKTHLPLRTMSRKKKIITLMKSFRSFLIKKAKLNSKK